MKINKEQISVKLAKLQIESMAKETSFICQEKKLTATAFVEGFFNCLASGSPYDLSNWAESISVILGKIYTKQGLENRLGWRCVDFCSLLLKKALTDNLNYSSYWQKTCTLFKAFNQVWIEDSTCLTLPALLAPWFPGSKSAYGEHATIRVQTRLNVSQQQVEHLEICSFREVDHKYADKILDVLEKDDLVIRDLGYWRMDCFEQIIRKKAFFISRLMFGVQVFCPKNFHKLELYEILSCWERKGKMVWEAPVLLGKKSQLPVRLIAIKVPPEVIQRRTHRAMTKKSVHANHSELYFESLGWTVFVTNIPKQVLSWQQILKAYGFRWRIEIIFKAWKNGLGFRHLFTGKQLLNPCHASVILNLFLSWLVLFFNSYHDYFLFKVFKNYEKLLSTLRFAEFFKKNFARLANAFSLNAFVDSVAAYCTYEKRNSRKNYLEELYMFNSC